MNSARDYETEHKRQLAVYKKLYSKLHDVPESRIKAVIAYVGLSRKINTGTLGYELVEAKASPRLEKTFFERMNRLIEYKNDPSKFVEELKAARGDDMLLTMIKQEL
ncbi:MAG: hypothetical protein M1544_02575 [Candidatus Marsarchaeota archaeon]|nr:hypothetical protein [Candidatus Marsarchaeota archaeon]